MRRIMLKIMFLRLLNEESALMSTFFQSTSFHGRCQKISNLDHHIFHLTLFTSLTIVAKSFNALSQLETSLFLRYVIFRALCYHFRMKLVSWNLNGIRAVHNKGLFEPCIETLKPDIICFQETKAEEHQSEVDLPEYEEYWNSAKKKGYSGTAIFSKVKPESVHVNFPADIAKKYKLEGDGYGDPNEEGRILVAEYKDFQVLTVYTPNSKPDLSRLTLRHTQWDPAFLEYCLRLEKVKPLLICGDMNVAHMPDDLANPKANEGEHGYTNEEREGFSALIEEGFVDTFRMFTKGNGHYTWWSHFANSRARNVGWRIDYFLASTSLSKKITHAAIYPEIYGSDHCPISIEISV